MAIYFQPIGSGIGDVLVCKPAFEWLVANSSDEVVFVARGPRQVGLSRFLAGARREVEEFRLAQLLKAGDKVINLRDHEWQIAHDWFSAQFNQRYGHLSITDILADICRSKGIFADQNEIKPLPFAPDVRAQDKIIFAPCTTMKSKQVPAVFWVDLASYLRGRSVDVILLGPDAAAPVGELVQAGILHIPTADLQEAVNLISSARAVVSVDSGLMHIAVQQGVNTVAIFGPCRLYCRRAAHCFPIFTDKRSSAGQQYPAHHFSASYTTWDYLPAGANEGSFIDFTEYASLYAALDRILA